MKLRTHLLFLALATLLPVLLFAVYVASQLVERERDTFRRGAADRTRAILTAVDLQINGTVSTLESVAFSRTLDIGDVTSFHTVARRVLASREDWRTLQLISTTGETLVDASADFGGTLSVPDGTSLVPHVVARSAPAVGHPHVGCEQHALRANRGARGARRRRALRAFGDGAGSDVPRSAHRAAPARELGVRRPRRDAPHRLAHARCGALRRLDRHAGPARADRRRGRGLVPGPDARRAARVRGLSPAPASAAGPSPWACPPPSSTRARGAARR